MLPISCKYYANQNDLAYSIAISTTVPQVHLNEISQYRKWCLMIAPYISTFSHKKKKMFQYQNCDKAHIFFV